MKSEQNSFQNFYSLHTQLCQTCTFSFRKASKGYFFLLFFWFFSRSKLMYMSVSEGMGSLQFTYDFQDSVGKKLVIEATSLLLSFWIISCNRTRSLGGSNCKWVPAVMPSTSRLIMMMITFTAQVFSVWPYKTSHDKSSTGISPINHRKRGFL